MSAMACLTSLGSLGAPLNPKARSPDERECISSSYNISLEAKVQYTNILNIEILRGAYILLNTTRNFGFGDGATL